MKHLVRVHFKKDLIKRFGISADEKVCTLCPKSFIRLESLLFHLAVVHNALADRVPEEQKKVRRKSKQQVSFSSQSSAAAVPKSGQLESFPAFVQVPFYVVFDLFKTGLKFPNAQQLTCR